MLTFDIEITGLDEVNERLSKLNAGLHDFRGALGEAADQLIKYYEGPVFDSKGEVYGTPWAQLAPSTQAYKSKHFSLYASTPLVATGAMRHSFRRTATTLGVFIDNTQPYFKYHQLGTRKMPQRRILGINEEVKSIVKQTIEADIRRKISGL